MQESTEVSSPDGPRSKKSTRSKIAYLKTNQNARRADFLRRKLRDILIRNEPMPPWFRTMIGCSRDELRTHLERHFETEMSWSNYGRGRGHWSIDHTRPMKSFRLGEFTEDCRAMHYSNLRPMWYCANSSKGDSLPAEL